MSSLAANIAVGTLVLGAVYGLVGSGFVVLFRSTGVVSFAQGSYMVLGALGFYTLTSDRGLGLFPAMLLMLVIMAIIGAVTYRVAFARIAGADHLTVSVATVGLGIVLQMVAYLVWGPNARRLPPLLSFDRIVVGPAAFTAVDVFTFLVGLILIAVIFAGLRYTRLGVKMRATADRQNLAGYIGINTDRMAMIAWGLAALTAAAAGIIYSLGAQLDPVSLPDLGLVVFPAVVLGGIDSIVGAVVGGLALGLLTSVVSTYLSGDWVDPVCYALLLLVLVVRPRGLFGSPLAARL
jgi:branched-chain amino acid transport system permease protein